MASKVDAYIRSAPEEQQPVLRKIRAMMRKALPSTKEEMCSNGFAVYIKDGEWVSGFATRKKGAMLYVMLQEVLDDFEDRLGRLRSGRACVDWKASKTVSLEELEVLAQEIVDEVARRVEG